MPSQLNVQLTGRIQNIIFYKRGDKYYARSVPYSVKQTKATKKRASEFGRASTLGKHFRHQLLPAIPLPADNGMQTRLVSALFQWLRSGYNFSEPCEPVPYLHNFQFAEGDTISERWSAKIAVSHPEDNLLLITIPSFVPVKNISAPAGTQRVKCYLAVAACDVHTGQPKGGFSTSLDFNYDAAGFPQQRIPVAIDTAAGNLVLTAVSLEYFSVNNGFLQKIAKKAFMPSGVVSAIYF